MTIQLKVQPLQARGTPWTRTNASEIIDIDGLSVHLHYTSLRDLISDQGPPSKGAIAKNNMDLSQFEFKDQLLKQAVRAYLLPAAVPRAPEMHFFARWWKNFANQGFAIALKHHLQTQIQACIGFFRTRSSYSSFFHAVRKFACCLQLELPGILSVPCNKRRRRG